jgi:hypothetical protein
MSQKQNRIRLAEAMEWVVRDGALYNPNDPGGWAEIPHMPLPDPFTDANDDYAVLEWMRKTYWDWQIVIDAFEGAGNNVKDEYHVGDFARVALEVLDSHQTPDSYHTAQEVTP